ncbi:hypothetical protein [Mycobacterium sp.]|uniref:hypothetical protein n=1 Tax=Mycobacterium sp. TaxID=1785 RepID=UPI003C7746D2
MRVSRIVVAGVAVATALTVSVAGCGGKPKSSTSTSASATSATSSPSSASTSAAPVQPGKYDGLLIQASDINAPVAFTGVPPTQNPNGQPGIATTFRDEDGSHVIKDTIQVLADPTAATNALNAAKDEKHSALKNPKTQSANVGTDGTTLSGNLPDDSKGVTVLLFTEGNAFVTLEFEGPANVAAPSDFVNDVGQKQDAAIKKGLGG